MEAKKIESDSGADDNDKEQNKINVDISKLLELELDQIYAN